MNKLKVLIGIDESYTRDKIIDCFKYRSNYEVALFDRNQRSLVDPSYDIYWLEYEDIDFERIANQKQQSKALINSFCIRKGMQN